MEKTETVTRAESCGSCRFCRAANSAEKVVQLICAQKPPTAVAALVQTSPTQMGWNSATCWPNVNKFDWCGSWEPQRH